MRFQTKSGATYEVDHNVKMARRISGFTESTPRMAGGGWKLFKSITTPVVGEQVVITWEHDESGQFRDNTITSPVESVG